MNNQQPKKTIGQWISELPEPTYLKAVKYLTEERAKAYPDDGQTMQDALLCAFQLSQTKEGYAFWDKICKRYEPKAV